jgi:hypothetical protein
MIGIIYKLKCLETGEFYIGSTFNIIERIDNHKSLKYNSSSSKHIIKRNNYKFIILEQKEVNNKLSLELIENLYILIGWKTSKCINNKIAYRTKEIDNFMKNKWRINNLEKTRESSLKSYHKNKEKNKEKRKKSQQKNYHKNKDIISEKRKEKVKCNYCNAIVNRSALKRHQSRNICLNNRLNHQE